MIELLVSLFLIYVFLRMIAAIFKIPLDSEKKRKKASSITPFNSHPGPCQACGFSRMNRGRSRTVGSHGFRAMFEWPIDGSVSVVWWHCPNCGAYARYGMHIDAPDKGWILLDRLTGGW